MALRAVFFDFGGTLLDMESDARAHQRTYDKVVEKFDLPLSGRELYDAMETELAPRQAKAGGDWLNVKDLTHDALVEVLSSLGCEFRMQDWVWFWGAYNSLHKQYLVPISYAAGVLADARKLGLHVGLVSDVDQEFLATAMEAVRLKDAFDAITTSEDVKRSKPSKEMFLAGLEKAKCKPGEAIHVGDSLERDVAGAKAVGIRTIHFSTDACKAADYCVASLQLVTKILKELKVTG